MPSTGAAICPPAPLLAPELTGLDPVIPELREACAAAAGRLIRSGPDLIAIVGPGRRTASWPAAGRLDLAAFAPSLSPARERESRALSPARERESRALSPARERESRALSPARERAGPALSPAGERAGPPLPLSLGLGARLLDEAGYRGPRRLQSVSQDEPAAACLRLGAALSGPGGRVGLLIMADGSACRSLRAPGYLDPRAAAFDATIEQAVRGGDLGLLRDLDAGLARALLAAARPAWQVLAGAMPGRIPAAEILYRDDPFGVFYLAAWLPAKP